MKSHTEYILCPEGEDVPSKSTHGRVSKTAGECCISGEVTLDGEANGLRPRAISWPSWSSCRSSRFSS
jgi:hypothetical protein